MASTYEPIATTVISGSPTSYTFSSIPQTFTDLVLIFNGKSNASGSSANSMRTTVNGSASSLYSETVLYGDGATAGSARVSNSTYWNLFDIAQNSVTGMGIASFMNYSNSTTYKTVISRTSIAAVETMTGVFLRRDTAAITSITLTRDGVQTLSNGSIFTLYGIAAA